MAIAALAASVITMSLCGGIEGGAASLRATSTVMDRFISVENNAMKRLIANNMNPADEHFPGIDHSWHHDAVFPVSLRNTPVTRETSKHFRGQKAEEDGP
jgi:hypothetical protein